ncbi:PfkB family carbohydrate kinase [Mucilaginibacter paludis]|nr:PfkB family carbohydrate kinase [Mucilaginibacter paludis]
MSKLNMSYLLVTSLAPAEMDYVASLENQGIPIITYPSANTVNFENIYAEDQDQRTQNVLQKADPFSIEQFKNVDANVFHLGPLLADDIPVDLIRYLAGKGTISLDVQGYLRKVEDKKVYPTDWPGKKEALPFVDILKADVAELNALTGCQDVHQGVRILNDWGVKEIVITNGSMGSLIYRDNQFYDIPAYAPPVILDATGCGDTYMAGYLYQRNKGAGIQQRGEFAAAMAGLKTASAGPFAGTEEDVNRFLLK